MHSRDEALGFSAAKNEVPEQASMAIVKPITCLGSDGCLAVELRGFQAVFIDQFGTGGADTSLRATTVDASPDTELPQVLLSRRASPSRHTPESAADSVAAYPSRRLLLRESLGTENCCRFTCPAWGELIVGDADLVQPGAILTIADV